MEEKEQYVFISYSSKNQQMADSIRILFIEKGIPCWMAPYDIPAGSKYAFVINDALEKCACLVLLLTKASQESQFVEREIERAITYRKPIVPMQLEDIQLNSGFKFYIGNSQIIAVPNICADAPEFNKAIEGIRRFVNYTEESNVEEPPKDEKKSIEQVMLQTSSVPRISLFSNADVRRLFHKVPRKLIIPAGYNIIVEKAFVYETLRQVDYIIIPDSVYEIQRRAFYSIKVLGYIEIPDSVVEIGNNAFNLSKNAYIKCHKNSFAHQYCINNEIHYVLNDM